MNRNRFFNLILVVCLLLVSSCKEPLYVDVVVAGGGASGVSAGIQSARMGVSTMIVEETPWLGGMLTSAGVSCIDGNYNLRSGIFGEFTDSLASHYGGYDALKTGWVSNICFEPDVAQRILSDMSAGCGDCLDVRRECSIIQVERVDEQWHLLVRKTDGKKFKVITEILVDATELGDIAVMCGADYRKGMDSSSETGESIAPERSNDVIQDLTYVAVLQDYGPEADMTLPEPEGYDPSLYADCCVNPLNTVTGKTDTGQTLWPAEQMISYGALPGGRYMLNWPIYGNDYYTDIIDLDPQKRNEELQKAKQRTLGFIYFIQTALGMKNLALAEGLFPTEDGLPLIPYHRESRRIEGEAFLTLDAAARPYEHKYPYYRTGIAVGDYAVDHHHFRHPDWKNLPDLHFYPIPSFNVPLGSLIPKDVDNLIVAEKSVSVSNLINGATRLQPVVMQIGQAAGAMAALSVKNGRKVRYADVRQVQNVLLDAGCYIMPYLDLPKSHPHFKVLQRIGATGILRGEGRNEGWTNQTWFRAYDNLRAEDIYVSDFYSRGIGLKEGEVSVGNLLALLRSVGIGVPSDADKWWNGLGLEDFNPDRPVSRLEASVVIDSVLNPFTLLSVDINGNFRTRW